MTRRLVIVACAGLVLLAAVAVSFFLKPQPAPAPPPVARVERPAEPPPARPTPKAEPEPATPASPRRAAPKVEPTPAPAPEPAEPAADAAVLRIQSDVPGALVFIDRQYVGTTPVTAPNVKAGTHRLNVSLAGYDPISDTIDVSPGPRDISIKFREVRLDLAIDVVHKHRIGSCQGRLVATAQGLRYETANKGDSFSAPLLDLDVWQIEYLEKILKVGVKNGKRFDFTDPAGNADRLFVFHRDVDKARERLKNGDTPAP